MGKNKYKILMSIALVSSMLTISSCGGDDDDDGPGVGSSNVEFRPKLYNYSRVSDIAFASNDAISVWAMESRNYQPVELTPSRSFANNRKYVYQGGKFKGDIHKPDDLTLNYYAVYPYSAQYSDRFNFSIKTDQRSTENYMASDLCGGHTGAVTSSLVDLDMVHVLCQFNITVDSSLGTATSIELLAKPSVTFDLNDWTVSSYGSGVYVMMNQLGTNSFRAIVPIAQIPEDTQIAIIHTSKGDFTWYIEEDTELRSGNAYSYTLGKNTDDASTEATNFSAYVVPWGYAE